MAGAAAATASLYSPKVAHALGFDEGSATLLGRAATLFGMKSGAPPPPPPPPPRTQRVCLGCCVIFDMSIVVLAVPREEDLELVQAQVFFRHGARAPFTDNEDAPKVPPVVLRAVLLPVTMLI